MRPLASSPLAAGRIANGKDDLAINVRVKLTELGLKYNADIESIAVAWLVKLGALPLIGTTSEQRIKNIVSAFDINLDNQADDHRLRVLVPTPFNTDSVLADTQFGSLTRPVNDSAMNNWQQEGWKEAPVPVWNMLNYVALQEGRNGMAVFSEGLREFEVIGEEKKTFAITLLRGVGLLGKEDLLLRPGRPSGIKMPVPDSQLRGLLSCRLSLLSYTGTPTAAGVAQQARAWLTPVQCYNKIPWDVMKLNKAGFNVPESYSLLKMPPVGCLISALKKAEDRQEVILRLFNPAESATCDATVAFSREVISCSETMMDEHITTEENQGSNLSGPFLPGQSRTFSYRLA